MSGLNELLRQKKSAIIERWQGELLGTYAPDAAAFYKCERNQFANPVGQILIEETRAIFELILEGIKSDQLCSHLNSIIKIRSVQDFSPSQAIGFVFMLKEAVREELKEGLQDAKVLLELMKFETQIDQLALFAFDIFTQCREQVYQLRVDEVKRRVSRVLDRVNRFDPEKRTEQVTNGIDSP